VAPRAHPRPLHTHPVAGGVLLAMEAAGMVPSPAVQARLATEARLRLG
jgi:hypothetical protein